MIFQFPISAPSLSNCLEACWCYVGKWLHNGHQPEHVFYGCDTDRKGNTYNFTTGYISGLMNYVIQIICVNTLRKTNCLELVNIFTMFYFAVKAKFIISIKNMF